MASLSIAIAITSLFLTSFLLPFTTFSQNPTIADCGPRLLPLAPCLPFVQGMAPSPAQPCCDSLKQLYNQQPSCLCLLLNGTALSSVPINTTLAMEMPLLCTLQLNNSISTCSGGSSSPASSPASQVSSPASSPASQVSFGTTPNTTLAASPTVIVVPRPSIIGFGFHRSTSPKLEIQGQFMLVVTSITFMLRKVLLQVIE